MLSSKFNILRNVRTIKRAAKYSCRGIGLLSFDSCSLSHAPHISSIISFNGFKLVDRIWPSYVIRLQKYAKTSKGKCWKCEANLNDSKLTCSSCGVLQKPDTNSNHYDVLGIKKGFDVDISQLTKKFRELQNILHPDRFSNSSKEELQISEDYSSLVNKAYSTLQNPLNRGLYLLELEGIPIEESNVQLDVKFLSEIMERNEELESVKDSDGMLKFNSSNKRMLNCLIEEISKAFKENNLERAKSAVIKMKYYSSIDGKIKEKKQSLGIPD